MELVGQRRRAARGLGLALLLASTLSAPALRAEPAIGGCPVFPSDNIWNARVDDCRSTRARRSMWPASAPARPSRPISAPGSTRARRSASPTSSFRADQAHGARSTSRPSATRTPIRRRERPRPLSRSRADAPVEGGPDSAAGDRHVLVVQEGSCTLYELYKAVPQRRRQLERGVERALRPGGQRPAPRRLDQRRRRGPADLPGPRALRGGRGGRDRHALRFTAPRTQRAYVWPARHFASQSDDPALPPMGQRFRLKAKRRHLALLARQTR